MRFVMFLMMLESDENLCRVFLIWMVVMDVFLIEESR